MEIIFKKVDYSYNKNLKISNLALKDINITIKKEKIYGITGPSGSGKTTFIQLINNLLKPTSGKVIIKDDDSEEVYKKNIIRKKIGLVFQFPEEQFFESTVKEELIFALKNFKIKNQEKKAIEILKILNLDETYLDKNPFQLSNGEKRKIAIASVLIYNPEIIILDEPFVGLDYKNKKLLLRILKKLKEHHNKTIIIVSHDIDLLYEIIDDIIIFKNKRIIAYGNKNKIFKNFEFLEKEQIQIPKIIDFSKTIQELKSKKIGYYEDVKDLIKAIYRNV